MIPLIKNKNHRRSIRLKEYDYAQQGYYFVTVCTQNREHVFGNVIKGRMELNQHGKIAAQYWQEIPQHFHHAQLDKWIVIPNHMHGILILNMLHDGRGTACRAPTVAGDCSCSALV